LTEMVGVDGVQALGPVEGGRDHRGRQTGLAGVLPLAGEVYFEFLPVRGIRAPVQRQSAAAVGDLGGEVVLAVLSFFGR
jgi:hypothetical protein